jgi:histidinol-phosphate aminotransferase
VAAQVINSGWHRENKLRIIEGKRRILSELSTLKVGYTTEEIPISVIYCDNEDVDLEKVMEKTGLKVVTCSGYIGLGKNAIRLNLHKDIDLLMDCLKETERLLEVE